MAHAFAADDWELVHSVIDTDAAAADQNRNNAPPPSASVRRAGSSEQKMSSEVVATVRDVALSTWDHIAPEKKTVPMRVRQKERWCCEQHGIDMDRMSCVMM